VLRKNSIRQHTVKMQERRRLEHDGGAEKTCPANEKHAQTGDHPVGAAKVRRAFAPAVQDQKLVPHKNGLGDDAPESSWLDQADDRDDQVKQKEQEIAHLGNRTKSTKPLISRPIWNSPGTASGLRILDVVWDGKVFAMFASDIAEWGDELCDQTAEPPPVRVVDPPRKPAEKVRRAAASELR